MERRAEDERHSSRYRQKNRCVSRRRQANVESGRYDRRHCDRHRFAAGDAVAGDGKSVDVSGNPEYRLFCLCAESLRPAADAAFPGGMDGTAIADALKKLGLQTQIVKAQMLYLTYFDNVSKGENFFAEYADCFKESDDKKLIDSLNQKYGLSIDYAEFMRSYAVISNVSIDENRFLNLDVKNNIDLARWAENAYETWWGYVPYTDGNVLSAEKYKALKEKYPDEITAECDRWQSRRAVDNYNLLRSYLWYDAENRTIAAEGYTETVQELYQSASVKGGMDTLLENGGNGGDQRRCHRDFTLAMAMLCTPNQLQTAWYKNPFRMEAGRLGLKFLGFSTARNRISATRFNLRNTIRR